MQLGGFFVNGGRGTHREAGFTIIEVLIAAVILMVVAGAAFQVVLAGTASMQRTAMELTARRLVSDYLGELGRLCRGDLSPANPLDVAQLRGTVTMLGGGAFTVLQDYGEVPDPLAPLPEYSDYKVYIEVLPNTPPTLFESVWTVRVTATTRYAGQEYVFTAERILPNYNPSACS